MTDSGPNRPANGDESLDDVFQKIEELEGIVDSEDERREVQEVRRQLERVPGGEFVRARIDRYTTRDVAEGFVGSILFSLPLLVEDGVFDIADHLLTTTAGPVPVWLVVNVAFIVVMTWGLLYWTEFREIRDPNPWFGFVPRRLVGVLVVSVLTAALTMTMWGRLAWDDPLVAVARISVVWAAAAFGAVLGDILPGESAGTDLEGGEVRDRFSADDD